MWRILKAFVALHPRHIIYASLGSVLWVISHFSGYQLDWFSVLLLTSILALVEPFIRELKNQDNSPPDFLSSFLQSENELETRNQRIPIAIPGNHVERQAYDESFDFEDDSESKGRNSWAKFWRKVLVMCLAGLIIIYIILVIFY